MCMAIWSRKTGLYASQHAPPCDQKHPMATQTTQPNLAELRREYSQNGLSREMLDPDPIAFFRVWFNQATDAGLLEPNAMILATVGKDQQPTQRTVLLKAYDERGFVFFTNYTSRKAQQIAENQQVSALFLWLPLERQVAITGQAVRISTMESLAYFASRPLGSRLGAWVSQQSKVIPSRKLLDQKFEEMRQKFADGKVPLPDFWGGYRIEPRTVEFWQGNASRLHDRFLYTERRDANEHRVGWQIDRLSP